DKAGGTSTIKLRSFIFDAVAPQTTILGPAHGGLYTGLSVASGTHQDVGPVSDVTQVEVNIWDQTSNKYWTGATWASSTSTVVADLWQSSWSITSAGNKLPPAWPSGHTFLIRSRATDEPGNVETLPDTGGYANAAQFQFDDTPPTSSVTDPGADDAKGAGFTVLAGVASDDLAVDKVEVQIIRNSVGLAPATTDYWNGTWGNFPTAYNDATGTDPWTYTLPALNDGYRYEVRCRAVDTAGNAEATPTSGNIFVYDVNIPTATITNPPSGGAVSALDQIDGSYSDVYSGAAVDFVKISIKNNTNGQYWDGGNWAGASEIWQDASETEVDVSTESGRIVDWISVSLPPWGDQQYYTIRAKGKDRAGNEQSGVYIASATFQFDASAPQSRVTTPRDGSNPRVEDDSVQIIQGWAKAGVDEITTVEVKIYNVDEDETYQGGGYWGNGNQDIWLEVETLDKRGDGYYYWSYSDLPRENYGDGDWPPRSIRVFSRAQTASRTETPSNIQFRARHGYYMWSMIESPALAVVASDVDAITGKGWFYTFTESSVSIKRVADQMFWDEATKSWVGGFEIWNPATKGAYDAPSGSTYFTFDSSNVTWSSGKYILRSYVGYLSGTSFYPESPHGGNTIFIDITPPEARVTVPTEGATFSPASMPIIQGTAEDDVSGLDTVDVMISKLDGGASYYWTGSGFAAAATWLSGAEIAGGNWSYDVAGVSFDNNVEYNFRARGTDNAGNTKPDAQVHPGRNATTDLDGPEPSIVIPANGLIVNFLDTISGTAADALSTVSQTSVSVKEVLTAKWWDGASFSLPSEGPSWDAAGGASPESWKYVKSFTFTDDNIYQIKAQATDNLQNVRSTGPVVIYFDTSKPRSDFTGVSDDAHYSSLATISGTADDDANTYALRKVASVEVHLFDTTQNKTYDGSNWATSPSGDLLDDSHWYAASFGGQSSGTWTYASPTWQDTIRYRVVVRATDAAGNVEVSRSTFNFTYDFYKPDPEKPDSSVLFPAQDQFFNARFSSFTGTTVDNPRGIISQVQVRVRRLPNTELAESTTYYWDNIAEDWSPTEPAVVNWPLADSQDPPFDTNSEPWEWPAPQSGLAGQNFWTQNYKFDVISRTVDKAGNVEVKYSTVTFNYDLNHPTATVTFPVNAGFVSLTGLVRGTAAELWPGEIENVEVRVSSGTGPRWYYTGSTWTTTTETWLAATLSPDTTAWWHPDAPWVTNQTFRAEARILDKAGNRGLAYSTVTFNADFTAPSSTISYPGHNASYDVGVTSVQAAAYDPPPGVIATVEFSYLKEDGIGCTAYWDREAGDWCSITELFYPGVFAAGLWTAQGGSTPTWVASASGIHYRIYARAEDLAANETAKPGAPAANSNLIRFTLSSPAPASLIIKPSNLTPHFQSADATLYGTANDPSDGTDVRLKDVTDAGDHWEWDSSVGEWKSTNTFNAFIAVSNFYDNGPGHMNDWDFTIPVGSWTIKGTPRQFQLESRATGDPDESPAQGPVTFFVDDTAPQGGITMPDVAFKKELPALRGTASDDADGLLGSRIGANRAVYMRLKRAAEYWDAVLSTFTAGATGNCISSGDDTCMPASYLPGPDEYEVTHASFTDGTAFYSDTSYTVELVIGDAANNNVTVAEVFTWDVTAPYSGIVLPGADQPINSLSMLSGTASDAPFTTYATSFSLRSLLTGRCFNPATNDFEYPDCPYWIGTSSDAGGNWRFDEASLSAALLAYGNTSYVLLSRTIDTARNDQTVFTAGVSSRTFLFDNMAPSCAIGYPAHEAAYEGSEVGGADALKKFRGTHADANAPWDSGVRAVEIRLYYAAGDTWYWQPGQNAFSSGTAVANSGWFAASRIGGTWQNTTSPLWRAQDTQYTIEARAEDESYQPNGAAVGNKSAPAVLGTDIATFIIDDTDPTVSLLEPAAAAVKSLASISGTANGDLAGVDKVEIRLQRIAGGAGDEDWTGSSWTALNDHYSTATLSGASGEITWEYADLGGAIQNNERYRIYVRVTDKAGKVRAAPGGGDFDFVFDDASPSAAVTRPPAPLPAPDPPPYSNAAASTRKLNDLNPLSGTASEAAGAQQSGLSQIWVAVSSGSGGATMWWSTSTLSFSVGPQVQIHWTSRVVTGAAWSYADSALSAAYANGVSYAVFARVRDAAGNWTGDVSDYNSPGVIRKNFVYDDI
ncbi:MAG: hypothetical protein ABII00_14225, partial [Elusimicrobiota bacterium]